MKDLLIVASAFALGTAVAEIVGAANLGVAAGVGQICFAAALVYVLLRPSEPRKESREQGV